MTGLQLKTIRLSLGLSLSDFGRELGYKGNKNTLSVAIRRMESGARPIPEKIAVRVRASGANTITGA